MKVGDLVRLSLRKTRKGLRYENMVGLIVEIFHDDLLGCDIYAVNFAGTLQRLAKEDLSVVSKQSLLAIDD